MQSLVSLEGYDPELREYLLRHGWPSIMEVPLVTLCSAFTGQPLSPSASPTTAGLADWSDGDDPP